jgi:hypothetical protein
VLELAPSTLWVALGRARTRFRRAFVERFGDQFEEVSGDASR